MGSLRNPVGPLPSTIYWRRRAVAATLIALLALLVVWVVTSRGGDGKNSGDTADGANPATSITPGPSGSGPAISEQPGGRDESGSTDGTGGGQGGTDGGADDGKNGDTGGAGGAGSGGSDGAANTGGASGGGSAGSGSGGDGGSTSSGRQVPSGSGLPNCPPSALTLRLTTTKVAYAPGEKPAFRLIATNTSDTTCKADFGPKAVVLTITNADGDEVWSSKDCPKTGGVLYEVPAGGAITRTIEWDRRQSAPQCATPPAGAVGPGTYLVEAKTSGASVKQGQASIRLEKD
ncbi:hypothetical protein OIE62_23895 [Streptomyces scopuliridis]|uniref:Uncharacterized protein n=1 Tax=Streptomyces scopuliridis TaxID=452529 RepID=A0ACD4ZN81_9ACTN|nr:hypothetical protein [Streptomyces scopuliridis]WSB98566.1 hypothetical protein OG835_17050 [Streptomyces scopuliridis]WSC07731.1 hypothetical protein OIE62_23895 [Streptomyces scopuliridis]